MTYGLVMIVKDGGASLRRTLPSLAPLIDAWCIVDTGSSDDTEAVIAELLDGIPGTLHHRPWVNFGHNRSEALELASGLADWLILSDADMSWTIDPAFVPGPVDAYLIEMGGDAFSWRLPLLVSGRRAWRSVGAVHEYTTPRDGGPFASAPTDLVRIAMTPSTPTPEKLAWHESMLREELEREPDNPRTVFYLAQTVRELGRTMEARALYLRRMFMGGWEEELYYAAWRAAEALPDVWAVPELLAAWERRPQRLEALAEALRRLNAAGNHRAAWQLSAVPLEVPDDQLFVHRDVWTWRITFERSIAAWWVGARDEFLELTDALLLAPIPHDVRIQVMKNAALLAA